MTHYVNPIKMILPVILMTRLYTRYTIDSRARYVAILFRCDDVIILQFDWTFLILGNRAKYLNLVHQTVSRACRYGLGMGTSLGRTLVIPLKVKHVKSKTPETGKKNNIAHALICAPALKITIAVL